MLTNRSHLFPSWYFHPFSPDIPAMAACGSLQHIFEKPLPESSTLIESLPSWNQIKSRKPLELHSFTEIFGELYFKENPASSSSSPPRQSLSYSSSSFADLNSQSEIEDVNHNNVENDENKSPSLHSLLSSQKIEHAGSHRRNDSFSSKNSESLQLCTEGLGFESFDDVEDSKNDNSDESNKNEKAKASATKHPSPEILSGEFIRRSRTNGKVFPPPISCIGRSGKPWVCLKSYRHDGRFVLKEVRIPTQEFLHACREDGRLRLHFVQPDEAIPEEEDETGGGEGIDDGDQKDDQEGKEQETELGMTESEPNFAGYGISKA